MENSNVIIKSDLKNYIEISRLNKKIRISLLEKKKISGNVKKLIEIYSITEEKLPGKIICEYKGFSLKDIDSSSNVFLKGIISLLKHLTDTLSSQVSEMRRIWNDLDFKNEY